MLIVPRQDPTPRAPIRQPAAVVPPATDFVPASPAQTPVLTQDAVSRGSGELIPTPSPVSGNTPTDAQVSTNSQEPPNAELTSNAQLSAASGGTSPPWALIGGGLALGLLGVGLTFVPSRQPPMPPTPPMQNNRGY